MSSETLFGTDADVAAVRAWTLADFVRAYIKLLSAPFGSFVHTLPNTPALVGMRFVVSLSVAALTAIAALYALRTRDRLATVGASLMLIGHVLIALTLLDRLDRYGQGIDAEQRYWLDAFTIYLGGVLFLLALPRRHPAWWATGGLILYFGLLQPVTWRLLPQYVAWQEKSISHILARVLGDAEPPFPPHVIRLLDDSAAGLDRSRVGLYGDPLMLARHDLAVPAGPLDPCPFDAKLAAGREPEGAFLALDMRFGATPAPDYVILWDGDRMAGGGINGRHADRDRLTVDANGVVGGATITLHERQSPATPYLACAVAAPAEARQGAD